MVSMKASGVGRPVDPSYPSNLFILIVAPVSGLAWMIWKLATEGLWDEALLRAFIAGMATFLAWALARELDPDRPWTAGVAAIGAAAVIGAGPPSLWVTFAVLMAARITARTTGIAPRMGDLIAMALLAGLAGSSEVGLAAGAALGLVLVLDRWLPDGARPITVPLGVVAIVAAVGAAAVWGALAPHGGAPAGAEWVIAGVAAVGLTSLGRPRSVEIHCDHRAVPITTRRVQLGRVVAASAAALTFVWMGGPGLTAGSAVWVALAAVALPTIRR